MSNPCDVDDILCQLNLLNSLKSLKANIGNESFKEEFPELIGLDQKLEDRIESQELKLRETISQCGQLDEAIIPGLEPEENVY